MSGAEVVAVILAAGTGQRMGGVAKALLRDRGKTFLAAIHDVARRAGVGHAVVVIGPPHGDPVGDEAMRLGLATVCNAEPDRGMASSVALGFAFALEHYTHCETGLLWPVDHPRVRVATLRAILAATTPGAVVIPTYRGRGGHPAGFGRDLWQDLASCVTAPQGARSVIRMLEADRPESVHRIDIPDAGVVADVDSYPALAGLAGLEDRSAE